MQYAALVTLVLLCQYIVYMGLCGKARAQGGVKAPAVTGDETFERAYRVQMNTLEQLLVTLPAMWLSAYYFNPLWAAGLGLVFFLGRTIYRAAYMADPTKRSTGMIIGFLANIALVLTGIWGVIGKF
jgi:uncharacterized membrane protein YecN with MAPEG domain